MATPTNLPIASVSGDVLTAAYVNSLRGAFRVLQVVAATNSTQVFTNGTPFIDTGLTATITPQSATSKILVLVSQNGLIKANDTSMGLRLVRGATVISNFAVSLMRTDTAAVNSAAASLSYLDSPATTSATTYFTQFNSKNAVAETLCQYDSAMSTIVLLEISA
jgi:hypothetical protein